jgi:hypothetical protein
VSDGCDNDGTVNVSVDVDVFGGTPPYTFSWKNSAGEEVATSEDLTSVASDAYTLSVTNSDPVGPCTAEKEFGPFTCCFFSASCNPIPHPVLECDATIPAAFSQGDVFTSNPNVSRRVWLSLCSGRRMMPSCSDHRIHVLLRIGGMW